MPELPEVETIRRYLVNEIEGKTIKSVHIIEPKQFIGDTKDVLGATIHELIRKGKVLTMRLSNNLYINIHLKMSGQILYAADSNNAVYKNKIPKTLSNKLPSNTTRVIINFTDGSGIFYNDLRKFGWIKISNVPLVPASADVLSPDFTLEYFIKNFKNFNKPIKPLLMEQSLLAGVGNIYANDACNVANINPERKAKTLSDEEFEKLYNAIKFVINEGIKYKGSSSKDESYISPDGSLGSYQHHFKVYNREGQLCPRGDDTIRRIKQNGRSSFYCPNCQK